MSMRPADPPDQPALISRRAALTRAAALLGTALAAPTIAGVLAGCGDQRARGAAAEALRVLGPSQERLVAAMAEVILPATDTPGARDVGVTGFVDRMLADHHPADTRERFLAGLARFDARALAQHGHPFTECTAEQQFALVDALDAQVFALQAGGADTPAAAVGAAAGDTSDGVSASRDDDVAAIGGFYRILKELTLVGYYTSSDGATRELRVNPMGHWRADVPYDQLGVSWA